MKVHTINYVLSSYLINPQGKLGPYHLLNILQDAASTHAQEIGLGFADMNERKMFWVLTRQNLVMKRWPRWHDVITIETWIRAEVGAASNRDFRIYLGDELLGECTTSWLPLNAQTRRPVAWDRSEILGDIPQADRVSVDTGKVPVVVNGETLLELLVRNSDIDQNMHVNNTKYAQWVLDAIPFDDHFKFELKGYQVNFLSEARLYEKIRIERSLVSETEARFTGIRLSDQRPVFASALIFSPSQK